MHNFQPFDQEEQYLIEAAEQNLIEPIPAQEKNAIISSIRNNRNKSISIRVNDSDLATIKQRANRAGVPYQTLINSVLHRYASGDILLKESF